MSNTTEVREIPEDLKPIVDFHGSPCPGTLLLTRLAQAAMRHLGVKRHDKGLFAYVESNRCHTSGVQMVTGCVFGTRRMVVKDYGKAAITLHHKDSGRSVRATARAGFPTAEMYAGQSNEEKFWTLLAVDPASYVTLTEVHLKEALPETGPPMIIEYCDRCGERVLDGMLTDGVCRGCQGAYYEAGRLLVGPS